MKVHELQVKKLKNKRRLGRGISAGQGKTAGRGTKGQNSRTGGGVRLGFEGGQNPLAKRLPKKRGFQSINHTEYQPVNISGLEQFAANAAVDITALVLSGLVKEADKRVKLLGTGEISKPLNISVHAASKSALAKISAAGGTITIVNYKSRRTADSVKAA